MPINFDDIPRHLWTYAKYAAVVGLIGYGAIISGQSDQSSEQLPTPTPISQKSTIEAQSALVFNQDVQPNIIKNPEEKKSPALWVTGENIEGNIVNLSFKDPAKGDIELKNITLSDTKVLYYIKVNDNTEKRDIILKTGLSGPEGQKEAIGKAINPATGAQDIWKLQATEDKNAKQGWSLSWVKETTQQNTNPIIEPATTPSIAVIDAKTNFEALNIPQAKLIRSDRLTTVFPTQKLILGAVDSSGKMVIINPTDNYYYSSERLQTDLDDLNAEYEITTGKTISAFRIINANEITTEPEQYTPEQMTSIAQIILRDYFQNKPQNSSQINCYQIYSENGQNNFTQEKPPTNEIIEKYDIKSLPISTPIYPIDLALKDIKNTAENIAYPVIVGSKIIIRVGVENNPVGIEYNQTLMETKMALETWQIWGNLWGILAFGALVVTKRMKVYAGMMSIPTLIIGGLSLQAFYMGEFKQMFVSGIFWVINAAAIMYQTAVLSRRK